MAKSFVPQDRFFLEAKAQNWRARSVFKLAEIQKRFALLRGGDRVLDLGAAPGSWSDFAAKTVGPSGLVAAVDLQIIKPFANRSNFESHVFDVFSSECSAFLREKYHSFAVILSDMAPKTSGVKFKDQWASVELGLRVLELCSALLRPGGNLVVKIFQGEDFPVFWSKCRSLFARATIIRPEAVRESSREVYVVAKGFAKK